MPLPELFGGNVGDAALAVEPVDPALVAGAVPDVPPAAAVVPPAAVPEQEEDEEDEDAEGANAPGNLERARSAAAAAWAELCGGVGADSCPWCASTECCRHVGDDALIELRACAAMVPRAMRASGIAYLATALAARSEAVPRAEGAPRRRGTGRDVQYIVRNLHVCRQSFLWVNCFSDPAWKLALPASDERGVYVPPHGRVGQSIQTEREKANRRAVEVFFINFYRHYGYPIPATEFSKTTEVLSAGLTVRHLYKDEFLPAITEEELGRYEFTEAELASPQLLAYLTVSAASIRRTLSSDVPHLRRGAEVPRAPARKLAQIAEATLRVPVSVASTAEAATAVKARVVTIATDISRNIASLSVFTDVWNTSPVLANMGISHSCTDACSECLGCYESMKTAHLLVDTGDGERERIIQEKDEKYLTHRRHTDREHIRYNGARDTSTVEWKGKIDQSLLVGTEEYVKGFPVAVQQFAAVQVLNTLMLSGDFMKTLYSVHFNRGVKVCARRCLSCISVHCPRRISFLRQRRRCKCSRSRGWTYATICC